MQVASHQPPAWRLWTARLLIAAVTFMNVQCALAFWLEPHAYAPSFELSGAAGSAAIQGFGLLFFMWNIPYFFALVHPLRFRSSIIQAILMQAAGFIGESVLRAGIPPQHAVLRASILRFIIFDGGGLLVLIAALLILGLQTPKKTNPAKNL